MESNRKITVVFGVILGLAFAACVICAAVFRNWRFVTQFGLILLMLLVISAVMSLLSFPLMYIFTRVLKWRDSKEEQDGGKGLEG